MASNPGLFVIMLFSSLALAMSNHHCFDKDKLARVNLQAALAKNVRLI
jgi:hypothetical protein